MSKFCNVVLGAFLLLALWLPHPGQPLAMSVLLCLILIGLMARLLEKEKPLALPPGFWALMGWMILTLVQLVPLPPVVLKFLAPGTWELYRDSIWILNPGTWMPLALVPQVTLNGFFGLVILTALFVLMADLGRDREELTSNIKLIGWGGGIFALFLLFGFGKDPVLIANPSHFWPLVPAPLFRVWAVLPLTLAVFIRFRPGVAYGNFFQRTLSLFKRPQLNLHLSWFLAALFMLLAGVRLATPLGLLLMAGVLGCFSAFLLARRETRSWWAWPLGFAALSVLAAGLCFRVSLMSPEASHRLSTALIFDRLAMVRSHILFGIGLGNEEYLLPRYSHAVLAVGGPAPASQHPIWSWLLAGGVIGILFCSGFAVALLRESFVGWRRRHNRLSLLLAAAVAAGLIALLFASSPSLDAGLWWFLLAGLLLSAVDFGSMGTLDRPARIFSTSGKVVSCILVGSLLVTGVLFLGGQGFTMLGRNGSPGLSRRTDPVAPPVLSPRLSRARYWTPLDYRPHLLLGEARLADGDYDGALPAFVAGLRLNPVNGPMLYRLGRLLAGRGRMEDGAALMESGMRFSPLNLDMRRDNVLWLLDKQRAEQALAGVKGLLHLAPEQTLFWLEYLSREGFADRELRTVLPPHSAAYLQYGEWRLKEDQPQRAEWGFRQAVDVARQTPHPEADAFLRLTYFLVEQGRIDEALSAARTGLERVPGSLDLILLAGGLYERSGLTFRARELYHDALLLHPGNQEVLMRLRRLGEG